MDEQVASRWLSVEVALTADRHEAVCALLEARSTGTGQTVDWGLAQEVAQSMPVVLAGGLTPVNVAEAIARVHPYGVDVSSGVELSPGKKDHEKVKDFIRAARLVAA